MSVPAFAQLVAYTGLAGYAALIVGSMIGQEWQRVINRHSVKQHKEKTMKEIYDAMESGVIDAVAVCHGRSKAAGWWGNVDAFDPTVAASKIALIHSELSEALEGVRKGHADSHLPHRTAEEVEMADALIRIFDYCGARELNVAAAMMEKLAYNAQRADHKPENRAAVGGKKI